MVVFEMGFSDVFLLVSCVIFEWPSLGIFYFSRF